MAASRAFRFAGRSGIGLTLFAVVSLAVAQGNADLRKQLESTYALTKATADNTDIVTAGAVLVLQKDNLQMDKVAMPIPTHNFYKGGELNQGGLVGFFNKLGNASLGAGADAANTRKFVAGEKFWVTKIDIEADGIEFSFLSDPIQDVRYHALLKIPFAKGQTWQPDEVMATVAQVIKPDGDSGASSADQQQAAAGAPAQAAPETKTIAIGQTKDQVTQMFGPPTKVVQLGTKEIDYYPDMKVTFVKNAVTNVE
jgi:hypothetical protein